ncbi:MAG TPA: hypothetical protein PLA43_17600 [Bryobacteraceae bacterium]|nr:hypothetical protein [Bryobacteraceae bacterium]HOL70996.1 hypothetical protein [Bryobacteraceae bacterium]HPQ15229.1 hypothetical protein [Bryobacteraceae bacterium]HPU73769.1 hypothetical protein [Bryobacteraceae bacterium]
MKNLRIVMNELPPRPRAAKEAEYSAVVGGCMGKNMPCLKSTECCAGLECENYFDSGICRSPQSRL